MGEQAGAFGAAMVVLDDMRKISRRLMQAVLRDRATPMSRVKAPPRTPQ